jgi:hypothetical protein
MADVTLRHPVTGFEKTVSSQKAVSLKENGWQDTSSHIRKENKEQDVPDVQAGKDALAAGNGSKPGKLAKGSLKAADKSADKSEKTAEQKEAEAGHAGLQVDTGASNA